jgi:hypothetical protein
MQVAMTSPSSASCISSPGSGFPDVPGTMWCGDQDMNPEVSEEPYTSEIVTPQDRKNRSVSGASGAAPEMASTTSPSPRRRSTGEMTSALARVHRCASSPGTGSPSLRS